jgi:hypothetical protein
MDKWPRRFLAWIWAVMRHGWTLLAAFLGSFLLTIPTWIGPLLPPAAARRMNESLALSVHTYRLSAAIFLGLGILYASFLAWNEERDATDAATMTPEARMLGKYLAEHSQQEQTAAMQELASEMRASRTHDRLQNTARGMMESNLADANAQRASKLAALSSRGKELYEMKLTENAHLESWTLSVEGWKRDVISNLTKIEAARFDAVIPNTGDAVGHAGALNRIHGDMRGRLLVWLERLDKIMEHYASLSRC